MPSNNGRNCAFYFAASSVVPCTGRNCPFQFGATVTTDLLFAQSDTWAESQSTVTSIEFPQSDRWRESKQDFVRLSAGQTFYSIGWDLLSEAGYEIPNLHVRLSLVAYYSIEPAKLYFSQSYHIGEIRLTFSQLYHLIENVWVFSQEYALYNPVDVVFATFSQQYHVAGSQWALDLLALINAKRAEYGLIPINGISHVHPSIAQRMAELTNEFDTGQHDIWEAPAGWQTLPDRIINQRPIATRSAENLQRTNHQTPIEDVFDAWVNSPPHLAGILTPFKLDDFPTVDMGWDFGEDTTFPGFLIDYYCNVFLGYGIPDGVTLKTWKFSQAYSVDGAIIETVTATYTVFAYRKVLASLRLPYVLRVSGELRADYSWRVEKTLIAPYHETPLPISFVATYTHTVPVESEWRGYYERSRTTFLFTAPYFAVIDSSLISTYQNSRAVMRASLARYTQTVTVQAASTIAYSNSFCVFFSALLPYQNSQRIRLSLASPYKSAASICVSHRNIYLSGGGILSAFRAPYLSELSVNKLIQSGYTQSAAIANPFRAAYQSAFNVAASFRHSYTIESDIRLLLKAHYQQASALLQSLRGNYSTALRVASVVQIQYGIAPRTTVVARLGYASQLPIYQKLTDVCASASSVKLQTAVRYQSFAALLVSSRTTYGLSSGISAPLKVAYSDSASLLRAEQYLYQKSGAIQSVLGAQYGGANKANRMLSANYSESSRIARYGRFPFSSASGVKGRLATNYQRSPSVYQFASINYATQTSLQRAVTALYALSRPMLVMLSYPYTGQSPVLNGLKSNYTGAQQIKMAATQPYSASSGVNARAKLLFSDAVRIARQLSARYDLALAVRNATSIPYSMKPLVLLRGYFAYSSATRIQQNLSAGYATPANIHYQCRDNYHRALPIHHVSVLGYIGYGRHYCTHRLNYCYRIDVNASIRADYIGETKYKTRRVLKSPYSQLNDQVALVTQEPVIYINNVPTDVIEVEISTDEGSAYWHLEMMMSDYLVYRDVRNGDVVRVSFVGEEFVFVVTEKTMNRLSPVQHVLRVRGTSPSALLDTPHIRPRPWRFDNAAMASDLAHQIAGAVDWQAVDWLIPGGRFALDDATPIQALQKLASAVGALVRSTASGGLIVRPSFRVSPPKYSLATPDLYLTDAETNLSISESVATDQSFNSVRISDMQSSYSDKIEFVADEDNPLAGTLRVYLSPWRNNVSVSHTMGTPVYLEVVGIQYREETELVEFKSGIGSVAFPIESIISVEWRSISLGAVMFEKYSSDLSVPTGINEGWGIANVTYRVKTLNYRTAWSDGADIVQFVVVDTGAK